MTSIYLLLDPDTHEPRYVGRSENPDMRLRQHLADRVDTPKTRWLKDLKGRGLLPELAVVEECADEQADERERFWIQAYRKSPHCRLTNKEVAGPFTNSVDCRLEELEKRVHSAHIQLNMASKIEYETRVRLARLEKAAGLAVPSGIDGDSGELLFDPPEAP